MVVLGPAGIGKSRLAGELARRPGRQGNGADRPLPALRRGHHLLAAGRDRAPARRRARPARALVAALPGGPACRSGRGPGAAGRRPRGGGQPARGPHAGRDGAVRDARAPEASGPDIRGRPLGRAAAARAGGASAGAHRCRPVDAAVRRSRRSPGAAAAVAGRDADVEHARARAAFGAGHARAGALPAPCRRSAATSWTSAWRSGRRATHCLPSSSWRCCERTGTSACRPRSRRCWPRGSTGSRLRSGRRSEPPRWWVGSSGATRWERCSRIRTSKGCASCSTMLAGKRLVMPEESTLESEEGYIVHPRAGARRRLRGTHEAGPRRPARARRATGSSAATPSG